MCMGFGCNAAGVVATRVIDSPRERLIAIITNNFSLCNGRWPTQILIASIFLGTLVASGARRAGRARAPWSASRCSAIAVQPRDVLGPVADRARRARPSAFSLELPPYRPPQILQTLYTSLIDRTIFVLWRAIVFAVPAGVVIWLVSNVHLGGDSASPST